LSHRVFINTEADHARGGEDLQDRSGRRRGGRQVKLHTETL